VQFIECIGSCCLFDWLFIAEIESLWDTISLWIKWKYLSIILACRSTLLLHYFSKEKKIMVFGCRTLKLQMNWAEFKFEQFYNVDPMQPDWLWRIFRQLFVQILAQTLNKWNLMQFRLSPWLIFYNPGERFPVQSWVQPLILKPTPNVIARPQVDTMSVCLMCRFA